MICKIDWLSFTMALDSNLELQSNESAWHYFWDIGTHFPIDIHQALFNADYAIVRGRAPYSVCFRRADNFVSVYMGGKQSHILIEISGGGCEGLTDDKQLLPLLNMVLLRLTRIDIAVDMETIERPSQFVATSDAQRFKSRSVMQSPSGETVYVGSRSSERYCRVYRYNAPHPRHHLLRCEFVLRHESAKLVAVELLDTSVGHVAGKLGNLFGWRSDNWKPEHATDEIMPSWKPERRKGSTVFWLTKTVFPSIASLVREGTITDLDSFLKDNLYRLLE